MTQFTITYNETGQTSGQFIIILRDAAGFNRRTLWNIDNLRELDSRIREWETNPPILGWTIQSVEKVES